MRPGELLSDQARVEVAAFRRFLGLGYRPDQWPALLRENPGWMPYLLLEGPPPPPGADRTPVTAWTWPG